MKLDNKLYDILNKVQRWLPALGILYLALCQIWNLPYGQNRSPFLTWSPTS